MLLKGQDFGGLSHVDSMRYTRSKDDDKSCSVVECPSCATLFTKDKAGVRLTQC